MILQIKRGNRVIAESADFSYSPSLQEVRKLTCEVVSVVPIEFKAYNSKSESEYDTVVYNGNTFILYQAPSGDNLNEAGKYKYSLLFYGKEVLLQNVAFLDIVSGTGGEINKIRYTHGGLFQFWGDAKQLAARIEANIESYNASLGAGYTGIGTWTLNVDAEGELTEDMIDITDGTNLFEALKFFYDKFYLNYYFSTTANGGIITITDKARPSVNWTFKQGDGGGAVKVSSSVDTSTPVITRIIPQGGSRNVPPEYKKDAKPADESRYCPYILLPNDSAGNIRYYIDSEYGLKNYGVRGKTISNTFSGIYPSIRGKKLGDLYPSGLPEWDTYKADGEPDPQSGKVAGEGASAATRIDKIIGSTPIKSDDSDSFFIYMTSPGFNLGYKVYEDGDSSDKINDNVQPQYKPHAMFDKYRDFESFDIYGTRAYYDQPVKVTATFSGKMLFSILPIGSDAVGKKVKINLRMVTNRVLGQASPLKEVVIGEEGATGMLEIPYDKTSLVGYIEKGQNTTVTIRVEFTFDSDVPAGSCKIGFSEEMTCNIHFGNQDGSQDRFYYKYASVTDAVFSMRTGTYTGTEFKINKNGIIPLYGEVNGDTGETEEDVAMFNKGARYKISCYRTDSDNAKLPLYTDGKSPSIAAGTELVILNIVMPESYVTMAENTLEKAALDYLSRYDHENRTVSLDISSGFVAEHPNLFIDFIEGNMLKVRDDGIGVFDFSDNGQIVDMQLQIQSLEIKYSKENMFPSYSCTIARRKILSFYERLAQENQTASTQNTTNVTLGGSGTGSGTNIFSEQLLNDLIASFQKFNGWFEWDEVNQALRCKSAFYTNQWISALGAQSGSGEPGGGEGGLIKAVYGFADLGKTFDDSNLSNTFNAYTINEIWKLAKEGGMNTDKLWQELGKDDPTKKIHISHLPDNKFVTLDTEQTVTASKIFTGQLSTANVVPSVNNASTLGLESKRWENIYAVDANISGTVKTQALQVGDIKIIYDSVNKAVTFEHIDGSTEIGFYTRGWISALGVSPGGSGGSGGDGLVKNVYGFSNLGTTFSDSDLDNTFNAYTINEIWKMAKEGGGIKNITQSGSGNAVTDMTLSSDGKTITAVFGEIFARQQDLGTLNNTVTQLSNKLNNFLEGSDADNIINKWKELEAFLDGLTESDNLAELLALKADKTITISAGTGLTGGGNLSANRTLSLATTGVKAGTYTKVTVDTYGRVTVGDNPTTLAGYGITDAVTLTTAQTISGRKTFSQNIVFNNNGGITYPDGNVALRNSDGHTILASFGDGSINLRPNGHNNTEGAVWINKAGNVQAPSVSTNAITIGDAQLVYDSANKALRVKHRTDGNTVGFYSDGWVSALGVKTGGSGGGSGVVNTVYSFANLTDGTTFSDSDLDNTFNAYTIKKLYDMAGQGGLDADAMWAELKKADSSKVIDASHIPTSVLDGRWVKKAGDTMTGTLTSASTSGAIVFKGVENCDITNIYKDNGVIRNDNGGLTSIRNGLRFNWYDTYWYIGNIRGSSTESAGFGVVDHNNKLVLRVTPNDVRAPRFMSTVATGLSPLIVSSNTTVDNLSADLLDGYHAFGTSNALIKYGYTVYGTEPAWCRIATYSIRNTEIMTDVCFVLHSSFSDLFGLLVVKTIGTAVVEGLLIASYNINRSNIRIYHDAEKKNIELYCYGGSNYSIIQANLLYSHDRNGWANTNITLYQADTKAPSWSTYVNPVFAPLQNSSEVAKKLQTPRTLWGQSFDGTANVSGNMTGVGNITMSGQLTSTVASGTAPFIVVSNTVVGNLNADLLDGVHLAGLSGREGVMRSWLRGRYTTVNQYFGNGNVVTIDPKPTDDATLSANTTVLSLGDVPTRNTQLVFHYDTNTIKYRRHDDSKWNDWVVLIHSGNYASYSDGRYVKKAGDTMTGDLAMDINKGFYIPHGTRVVKTSGNWIHGGGDTASSTDANLRFGSWNGIGWYPTISGQTVAQGKNAMWLNVRNGNLDTHGVITSHNGYLAANWDSARRLVLGGGSYAWIESRDSSNNVLCNIGLYDNKVVIGNYAESRRFVSTVGTGTQPYQCNSTTLNTNLNADLLDGHHGAFYQNRGYDNYVHQYNEYDYIEFLRFVIPSGQTQLAAHVIFDLCRVETGGDMSGRAVLRIRRDSNNNAGCIFYVTNFGRSWLPELRCTTDDSITWRVWMKCVKTTYDPFIMVKILEENPYGTVTTQHNGTTGTPSGSKYTVVAGIAGLSNAANILVNTRNIFGQPFNGSGDVGGQMTSTSIFVLTGDATLKVYSGRITDARSDGNICLQTSIDTTDGQSHSYPTQYQSRCNLSLQPRGGQVYIGQNPDGGDTGYKLTVNGSIKSNGNIIATGAITAKASSSDIRLKTDIQGYDAMGIIRKFRSVKYHWNNLAKRNSDIFNHKKWNYGLIAQDLLSGGYSQWVSDIFKDYYTIDYERLIPVVWKGLQEVDDEVTRLKKRVRELEKRLGINNK